jgi:hypothetical protein
MVLAYRSRPAANRAVTPAIEDRETGRPGRDAAAGIAWPVVAVLNLTTGRMLAADVTEHGPVGAIRVGELPVPAIGATDGPGAVRGHHGGGRCR